MRRFPTWLLRALDVATRDEVFMHLAVLRSEYQAADRDHAQQGHELGALGFAGEKVKFDLLVERITHLEARVQALALTVDDRISSWSNAFADDRQSGVLLAARVAALEERKRPAKKKKKRARRR
jgi:hypothetical protein